MGVLVFVLTLCVDYGQLFSEYNIVHALRNPVVANTASRVFVLFFSVYTLYWFYQFILFLISMYGYWRVGKYLAFVGVKEAKLPNLLWHEVCLP